LLARVYGAFFLAFGVGALLAAYERRPAAVRPFLIGSLGLLVCTFVTSLLHLDRFDHGPVRWVWFGVHVAGLALLCLGLAALARTRSRDDLATAGP
jgi:peptidoglycan/LPS O-acetylase OafA/YrhL